MKPPRAMSFSKIRLDSVGVPTGFPFPDPSRGTLEPMTDLCQILHGVRTFGAQPDAQPLRTVQDAVDLIGQALSHSANLVVIPVAGLDPAFFQLRTGLAGEGLQKFVNYGLRVAILGDTAALVAQSVPLRDFIRGSNRGNAVWFLDGWPELEKRLAP